MYQCKRCEYQTSVKGNYKKHIYRLNVCASISATDIVSIEELRCEFEKNHARSGNTLCNFCSCKFASTASRSNHYKVCKAKKEQDNRTLSLFSQEEFEKQVLMQVKKILDGNMCTPSITNVQQRANAIQNNTVNININIRDFEDVSQLDTHIPDDFKISCLLEKNIPKLIKAIYCNDQRPDNMCVRLKNKKEKLFEIVKDGKWVNQRGDGTLKDLIDNGYRILKQFWLFEGRDEVDRILNENDCRHEVKSWMDKICEDDPKTYSDLKVKTFLIFVDQKGQATLLSK